LVFDDRALVAHRAAAGDLGKAARIDDSHGRYLVFLKACVPRTVMFDGLRVVIDCANGAGYKVGPEALDELGAEVVPLAVDPNGKNINLNCGATHPDSLRKAVVAEHADIGIALDGDGDRAILVDEKGELFDGDDAMALLGTRMASEGRLQANTVVATVMSNFGLELALRDAGIKLVRTEVGDPAVAREMRLNSYNLGGEQSGHVIVLDHSTTGDGLITALLVLTIIAETGRPLSGLRVMHRVPQVLENVKVRERRPLDRIPAVQRVIAAAERRLNGSGRLLVRYSGTEMVARVMVEGDDAMAIRTIAQEIGSTIHKHLGAPASAPSSKRTMAAK
jgi:phosphoglucosamine mutase